MKNFGTLYWYELKKLMRRKAAWGVVLAFALLMAYAVYPKNPTGYTHTFTLQDKAGNIFTSPALSSKEQREISRAGARRISGLPMDEAFFHRLRNAVTGEGLYEMEEYLHVESYFFIVDSSYHQFFFTMLSDYAGLDASALTAEQFYTARRKELELQWNLHGLTDAETSYWRAMEERVEKPFTYQYAAGYGELLLTVFGLSNLIPLCAAVCLCGVFSEETRTRADTLLLSSRLGRFPLYLAKILAGTTASLAAGLLMLTSAVAALLPAWGWDGFGAALQLWLPESSLPLTMGQAVLILYALLLLYSLLCGAVTMLISALSRNTAAALAAPVLLVIGQAWLRVDIQAAEYLPNQLFNAIPTLRNLHLVHFPGGCWNHLQFAFILYGVLTVLLTAFCWAGWRRNKA